MVGRGQDLRQEFRACLGLATPLALAQLAQMATGFFDTVMMGRLGSEAIAGGGLGAITFNFLMMVAGGLLSAVSPLVAEAFGAEDGARIRRIFWQGIGLALVVSLGCMGLLGQAQLWLPLLGQTAETMPLTQQYLGTVLWACPLAFVFIALRSFVAALGLTRPVMAIVIAGTAINVAGNYSLALGKFGLPPLGLRGIALASVLASLLMLLAMVVYLVWQPRVRPYGLWQRTRLRHSELMELLRVGLPIGGLAAVEGGLFTVTSFLMAGLGTVALAAHQIALQTAAMTFMVPMGVAMAAIIRVGQLMGQKQFEMARRAGQVAIAVGGCFMGAMALVMWLVPGAIVALYIDIQQPANQAVVAMAKTLLGVAAVFQIVDGIQVTAAGALRGLKDTRIPLLIGVIAYWCIGLLVGYGLAYWGNLGGIGLWWGLAVGLLFAAITLSWRFNRLLTER
ncbi:MATE family efflux transporter [filamentous cyanobacterium CCP5]|nr:MATE family efflux transporter [filamentous cyanobacterium CCP5]